jgi:alpha-1,2-mannosyltransferase
VTIAASAWLLDRALQRAAPPSSPADRAARLAFATLLGVGFYPLIKAYTLGQMQVVVNACFAGMLCAWWLGWRATAGVLVALMAAVKPQYGLFALWGIARREWRFTAAAAGAGLAVLALSALCFGFADHVDYLRVAAHVGRHGEAYWPNQSPNGFLQRLLHNGESAVWDPHVYPPYHAVVYAGTLLSSAALLAGGLVWPPRTGTRADALDLAGFGLALTLASPLAWEHHFGVLLPILALALGGALEVRGAHRSALWVVAACALIASQYWDALVRLSGTVWNPLQSLLLFASLTLLALLLSLRRRVQ